MSNFNSFIFTEDTSVHFYSDVVIHLAELVGWLWYIP
uniref:Uncharacterized protein n=1 Tax=Anguilla anguilla TaxID=7936 RepID=A0A0E9Q266_ANGAN